MINKIYTISVILFYILSVGFVLINASEMLFALLLIIWLTCMVYFLFNLKKHIVVFFFFMTLFTFLIGREVLYKYFNEIRFWVVDEPHVNNHVYILLILAMLGTVIGYALKGFSNVIQKKVTYNLSQGYLDRTRTVSKLLFYLFYVFLIIKLYYQFRYVQSVGYIESYQSDSGAGIPSIVDRLSNFSTFAFYVFLATAPKLKEIKLPTFLYGLSAAMTLLTGQRFPMMGMFISVVSYLVLRNRTEKWFERKHVIMLCIAAPISILLLNATNQIRVGKDISEDISVWTQTIDFFAEQGGSLNVVKNSYQFADQLSDVPFYSFNSISTNILNTNQFSGNSVNYALNGDSLAHRMSLITYGASTYLRGRGTGTSFIAELYHDFGYIGVFIGSIVYGLLIRMISSIRFNNLLKDTFLLLMIYPLMFVPRSNFSSVIGQPFKRSNIVIAFLIVAMTLVSLKLKPASVTSSSEGSV